MEQTNAQRAGVIIGEDCPLCGVPVRSRDHYYDRHSAKGRARRKRYEGTEKAAVRRFRGQEKNARKKAQENAQEPRGAIGGTMAPRSR